MKLFLDFSPIVLFFAAYKTYDIYVATGVLMIATMVQMAYIYYKEGRLDTMQKVTLGLILVFGAFTLIFQNENFIKFKPTVLYAGMSLALAIALWGFKKNALHGLLGKQISLPTHVWHNLTVAWIVYCAFMAAANAFVALMYSTDTWVNFKLWGYAFPVVFLVGQAIYISRYIEKDGA